MLKNPPHVYLGMFSGCLLGLLNSQPLLAAADTWLHCAPATLPVPGLSSQQELSQTSTGPLQAIADEVRVENDIYFLRGDVVSRQHNQELLADKIDYDGKSENAHAEGNLRFQQHGQILSGEIGDFQLGKNTGEISPARFWLTENHLRGDAEKAKMEGANITILTKTRFTTCDEGSDAWYLKATSLVLDTERGVGIARNARVNFMHVPIFYFPYFSFPIDDRRKSGFLLPGISLDDTTGTELSVPYYWNIAPHRDATITPTVITKRGLLLETEFRYLNVHSAGQLELGHLNGDNLFGDDRTLLEYQHHGEPAEGWRTNLEYRYASDGDYLGDFGSGLDSSSVSHLERRGEVAYRADSWQTSLLLQEFQTLDKSTAPLSRPYKRLPQVLMSLNERELEGGIHYGVQGELVRFDRDAGVVAKRLDVQPYISWPWRGASGFLVPTLKYRHTAYDLERSNSAFDESPSRSLPLFSIDSGLLFERELSTTSKARRQTLEPRLFYLRVPYRNQDSLIVDEDGNSQVFDSSLTGFGFGQLFLDNRFNGADRVGDANQLSFALTTRFLDAAGRDLLNASLGRSFYFQDREVTLPGGSIETKSSSDWIAEMNSNWSSRFSSRASLLWDTAQNEAARGTLDLRYSQDEKRNLRFAYRYQRDSQKQVDLAGMWPIASQWNLVGRWLHSLHHDVTLETLGGLEYESCCWNLRLVQRRSRESVTDTIMSNSIWLQLELKGLTSVGDRVNDLLARDILAY